MDAQQRTVAARRNGVPAATSITVGLMIGVVAGMLTGNVTLYIGVGLALGLALGGSALARGRNQGDGAESPER